MYREREIYIKCVQATGPPDGVAGENRAHQVRDAEGEHLLRVRYMHIYPLARTIYAYMRFKQPCIHLLRPAPRFVSPPWRQRILIISIVITVM